MSIVVSEMIKKYRTERGLTTKQLGKLVGLSDGAISMYETAQRRPPVDVCVKLADVFDVSLDLLIRGKEKDHSEEWSKQEMINRLQSLDLHDLQAMVLLSSWLQYRKENAQPSGQESEDKQ